MNQARPDLFNATVAQLNNGRTQQELSEALNELVQACRDTNKVGEITLKIKVRPDGASGQYFLEDQMNVTLPKFDRAKTLFFGTPEGNLQRTDPAQAELDVRAVQDATPQAKTLNDERPKIKAV
jgi:hypothetical protein